MTASSTPSEMSEAPPTDGVSQASASGSADYQEPPAGPSQAPGAPPAAEAPAVTPASGPSPISNGPLPPG